MARRLFVVGVVLGLSVVASQGFAEDPAVDSVEVATADGVTAVSLGLDAQLRFGVKRGSAGPWSAGFRLRRFRPIIGFRAFEDFEVKVVPELAGEPELKDGVVRWSPVPWFKAEAGQFAPPFNWERDGSSDFHQFTERSVANAEFQIADGRDIGAQVDFEWEKWLDVEVGVFNGSGSNTRVAAQRGPLLAGRVAYAPFGYYHEVEVIPEVMEDPVFMGGVGGYWAVDNAWRDWRPPGSEAEGGEPVAADVWSATADAHLWWWRLSLHGQFMYRDVRDCCGGDEMERYTGMGLSAQAGVLLIPERWMVAIRYSQADADRSQRDVVREAAAVMQIFHRDNRSKVTVEAGGVDRGESLGGVEEYGRVQYQLLL